MMSPGRKRQWIREKFADACEKFFKQKGIYQALLMDMDAEPNSPGPTVREARVKARQFLNEEQNRMESVSQKLLRDELLAVFPNMEKE